jgi:hypothetical protein
LAITGQCKRRRIVINADAYISGATSNVPVLVKFNSTSHPDLFATGDDKDSVWFSADASGQTTLYHEGVVFDATDAIFYVKVDLSSTADTVIYFWYGQPTITGTESASNVWTNGVRIWHMEDLNDTLGAGNLTNSGTSESTSGISGKCRSFDGSNDSLTFSNITVSTHTIMIWWKSDIETLQSLVSLGSTLIYSSYPIIKRDDTGAIFIQFRTDNSSGVRNGTIGTWDTNWHFITTIAQNDTTPDAYMDASAMTLSGSVSTAHPVIKGLGVQGDNDYYWFDGLMDEVWIFSDNKTADFIKAVYENVNNYSTFITIDGAVTIGSSPKMIVPVWPVSGGTPYDESPTCGIGLTATVTKQRGYARAVSSGLGISAAITKQADFTGAVTCGIGISVQGQALSGFDKRISLTIDHTKLSSTLTDFPLLIKLSTSSGVSAQDISAIFTELGANSKKIAVTTSNNTQCYVEIERWDNANNLAILWAKIPSISHETDTTLYLYYDSTASDNTTYVGDTDSEVAENVWDSNYKGVFHFNSETTIKDSTSNDNDGSITGTLSLSDGQIGKAVSIGANEYITLTDTITLTDYTWTISYWLKEGALGFNCIVGSDTNYHHFIRNTNVVAQAIVQAMSDTTNQKNYRGNYTRDTDWHYYTVRRTASGNNVKIFADGQETTYSESTMADQDLTLDYIGRFNTTEGYSSNRTEGLLEELRVSNSARSDAWLIADYNSQNDSLITYSSEQSLAGVSTQADFNRTVSCGLGIAAAISSQSDYIRAVSCGLGIAALAEPEEELKESVSASIGVAAGITTQSDYIRSVSGSLGVAAGVTAQLNIPKSLNCAIGIAVSITTQADYNAIVSAGIGVAAETGRLSELTQAISCGIGISATVSTQADYLRSISCGIGIDAAVTAQRNVPQAISSGIGINAAISHQSDYLRAVAASLGISVDIEESGGAEELVAANIGISGSITTQANFARSVALGVGITATIEEIQGKIQSIDSAIGITAEITAIETYNRSLSCGIGMAAGISSQSTYSRALVCSIGLTGLVTIPAFEIVACGLGINAAVTHQADFNQDVSCGIGLTVSITKEMPREISCGIGLTSAIITQADFNRAVNSGIGLSFGTLGEQGYIRNVSCGIGMALGVSRTLAYLRNIPANLGLDVTVSHSETFTRSVSSGIGLAISPITQADFLRGITSGIGLTAMVTHKVYTDLDNYNVEKVTVSKNIQDAMWQTNVYIDGTTIPAYFRHYIIEMTDYADVSHTVFHGFFPNADYNLNVANNKVTLTAYDYGWYLAAQYVPNTYRITSSAANPSAIILALLGGDSWRNTTGIEPYNIQDVDAWGTTLTAKSFVFDKKTSKKQAIDEICTYTNHIFVLKWRIDGVTGEVVPCAYFIHEDDVDTELDLPSKVTFTSPSVYVKNGIKIEDKQNEKVNRVRVAGANPITGDWYEAVVESAGVTYGDEIAIEYYAESSNLDTQQKVDDKAQALFDFFNTVAKTYTATLIGRADLELYQLVNFSGYSLIGTEDMRIIGISYTDYGTHNETTIQFTSDQALSDLKALNRSMGGDIYNNTTNILNHYFIDLTKIAVGTITGIDGNSATIELEDGSGFVTARLINQDE